MMMKKMISVLIEGMQMFSSGLCGSVQCSSMWV